MQRTSSLFSFRYFLFFVAFFCILFPIQATQPESLFRILEENGFFQSNSENPSYTSSCEQLILTNKNSLDKLFFLKKHPVSVFEEKLFQEQFLYQTILKEKGLPTKDYIYFNFIPYLKIKENGLTHFFSVQKYEDKLIPWRSTPDQIVQMAKILQKLHTFSYEIDTYSQLPHFKNKDLFKDIQCLLSNSYIELKEKYPNYSESLWSFWKEFLNWASSLINLEKRKTFDFGYPLLSIPIHGDFHHNNLLFDHQGVFALIDFDNSCLGDPLEDVIRAILHMFVFDFKNPLNFLSGDFNSKTVELFLLHYSFNEPMFLKLDLIKSLTKIISVQLITLYFLRGLQTEVINIEFIKKFVNDIAEKVSFLIQRTKPLIPLEIAA